MADGQLEIESAINLTKIHLTSNNIIATFKARVFALLRISKADNDPIDSGNEYWISNGWTGILRCLSLQASAGVLLLGRRKQTRAVHIGRNEHGCCVEQINTAPIDATVPLRCCRRHNASAPTRD
jgi:hypothetical protein